MVQASDNLPTILLVEDEPAHAELIGYAFESYPRPMKLSVAFNLDEARKRIIDLRPDLVIADLILPDGRGTELLALQRESPQFPVLVLTSNGNEQVAVEAMKSGAMDYVVKSESVLSAMPHIAERALSEWDHSQRRRLAEEESQRNKDQLAHATRVSTMGEMAAGIAHELNQPLSAIAIYSSTARRLLNQEGDSKQDLEGILGDLEYQVVRAGEIVRRLRNFVKKGVSARTSINLQELIREMLQFIDPEIRFAEITLDLHLAPSDPVVHVDAIQIQQVMINLVMNAIEAILESKNPDRRILIQTLTREEDVEISVEDSGSGIPAENPDKLFDAFYTTKETGMGMGLAISRTIIESHRGTLSAEASSLGGARIRFSVPLDI